MRKIIIMLVLLAGLLSGAKAQSTQMRVFVTKGTLDAGTAAQLAALLGAALNQGEWIIEMEGEESLRDLVLDDHAPQMVICDPQEALIWAKEGLLLPLTEAVCGQEQIQEQVIDCCLYGEQLFMAPLYAHQRKMAVNRDWFEAQRLGYMLGEIEHPVWYLTQFQQIMEEFALADRPAFEIWPPETENCAAIEAFVQSLFGGTLQEKADSSQMIAGVKWIKDMMRSGMIACADDRSDALMRFVRAETPIFIDWTRETQRLCAHQIEENGIELLTMPYPSASGEIVRAFDVTGISAFAGENEQQNELAVKAVAFLHEDGQAQHVLGSRRIGKDDAVWLADLSAVDGGMTVRSVFASALYDVLMRDKEAEEALSVVQAAMDAMR